MLRDAVAALATCIASWVVLAMSAGNVGLQQSVSIGPRTLLDRPAVIVAVALTAFSVALLSGSGDSWKRDAHFALWVILDDVLAAAVLAPIAIGELTVADAPRVFAAVSVVGIQPVLAFAGAILAGSKRGRRKIHL